MVANLEDISLKICPAIGNTVFGIGFGITHKQAGNTSSGHLQDDGVLVEIVREVAVGLRTGMVRPGSRLIVSHGGALK